LFKATIKTKLISVCSSVLGLLVDVVVQQLDDEVDVGKDHPSAAVALAAELVKCLAIKRLDV